MIQFIIELAIYLVFALILSYLAKESENEEEYQMGVTASVESGCHSWNRYLSMYVAFFTIIAAVRWNVGSDSLSYSLIFENGYVRDSSTEYIFDWLVDVVHGASFSGAFGLGIMAFIQIFFITKALQKYKYILVVLPFVLFGGRYWQDLTGACRQMMVAAIFLWSLRFVVDRKPVWYFTTIFASYFIHHSALLLLPVYFIPINWRILNKRWLLSCLLIACCVIGLTPQFQGLANYVQSLSSLIGYDSYTERVTNMMLNSYTEEKLAFGPMMLSYLLIPLAIIWFGPYLEERFSESIPEFYLWYNIALIYSCLYFLFCNVSHLFIRPLLYLSLEQMVMAALLLRFLIDRYRVSVRWQMACLLFCAVVVLNTTWEIFKAAGMPYEITTYKTVFFNHQ